MKISDSNNKKNFSFLLNSMSDDVIEELDLDLSSKTNVFASGLAHKNIEQRVTDIKQIPTASVSNPLKRLNAYDNEYLYSQEIKKINIPFSTVDNNEANGLVVVLRSIVNVGKKVCSKLPIISYFMLKDKQNRLKSTLSELSSINTDIDSLVAQASPYGEQSEKYRIICDNLVKANNLHSQIKKEMET